MHDHVGPGRWALAVFTILAAVAIGTLAYQAGVSRGLALQPPPAPPVALGAPAAGAPPVAQAPYPYSPYYPYYPYRFYGRRPFGFFGPLLLLFFVFFLIRRILWFGGGGGWRHRRWNGDPDAWSQRFDEWHRRSHERMGSASPPPTASQP